MRLMTEVNFFIAGMGVWGTVVIQRTSAAACGVRDAWSLWCEGGKWEDGGLQVGSLVAVTAGPAKEWVYGGRLPP